ncbi:MAG: putative motility protein [Spirochaetaceae bacterium]|nr:MAG: putative motility protein [Spirochaetaceae bacterium]
MIESLTNLHTGMQQSTQQTEVSAAVLAKSIETVEQAGENVESMLQAAGTPFTDPMIGQRIDLNA